MRILLEENVYEAALRRVRWLFDEFPVVVVNVSGGKAAPPKRGGR